MSTELRTMSTTSVLFSLEKSVPICRIQLYRDVVSKKKYGPVFQVWISPGHTFVSVRNGIQLFTFDTKNTTQDENKGCLDLQNLDSPILDILSSDSRQSAYIVQQNGNVQGWKFRADRTWILEQEFNLCNSNRSEVTSVCLHPVHSAIYWCERRGTSNSEQPIYCICRRKVTNDGESLSERELGPVEAIMHNVCLCRLHPIMHGIAIIIKSKPPLVSMVIFWNQSTNTVTMYSGPYTLSVENPSSTLAFDFTSLAFRFINISIQVRDKYRMIGCAYNTQKMEVTVIEDSGIVRRFSDGRDKLVELKLDVSTDSIREGRWLCHKDTLGFLGKSNLLLFDLNSGRLVCPVTPPGVLEGVCSGSSASVAPAVHTENNIYIVMKHRQKEEWDLKTTLSSKAFQTTALHIAHLEQEKTENPTTSVQKKLSELQQAWLEGQKPATKLAEIVGPYLEEYWKLENIPTYSFQPSSSACPASVEEEVLHILDPKSSLPMSGRHARLLTVAHSHPKQVLGVLESQMEFDTDDISPAQIQRWQCILAPDTSTSPVSSDVAVPMFEHICRLLYQLQPKKLKQFVKICQMINDQKVGVSAFIRKRQAIQYYERAVACIQDVEEAVTSPDSAQAFVSLLLASKQEKCEIKALRFYLDHRHWELALDLVRDYCDNSQLHFKLFYCLIDRMNKENVLTDYAVAAFSLMPNIRSFSSVTQLISPQEVWTASDVFSSSCVPIGQIKSILQRKLLDESPTDNPEADDDLSRAVLESQKQQSLLPLVKQELKYKIRYKRLSEGKEEFVPDEPKPTSYELTEYERQKIEERRRQNRQSAQRSRKKSEDYEENLKKQIYEARTNATGKVNTRQIRGAFTRWVRSNSSERIHTGGFLCLVDLLTSGGDNDCDELSSGTSSWVSSGLPSFTLISELSEWCQNAGYALRRFSVCSVLQDNSSDLDKLLQNRTPRDKTQNDRFRFNRSDGGYLNDDRVRKHFGHQDDPWNDFYGVAPKERQEFSEVEKNFYLEHEAIRNMKEEEVKAFHVKNNVKVYGDVPRPVFDIDHVNFPEEMKAVLTNQGINTPTPIQSLMWPIALSGLDSVGIAQTGSGKTLGFMLPAIVHTLNQKMASGGYPRSARVLIMSPTRELTQQIASVSRPYCSPYKLWTGCIFGGASKSRQLQQLLGGVDIIVATPGRLLDILNEHNRMLDNVTYVVLDEADRMLDMGFEPQIRKVMNYLSPFRQTTMWSATWPTEVKTLAQDFMSNNVQVHVGEYDLNINKNITQKVVLVEDERDKLFKFVDEMKLVLQEPNSKVLMFTNTKAKADNMAFKLKKALKQNIKAIHGDISQIGRDSALRDFKLGTAPILVATDVAARGIDVNDITHVVNYDFPLDLTNYVHRVGRTGRAGRKGDAISFFSLHDQRSNVGKLVDILRESNQDIPDELLEASEMSRRNPRSRSFSTFRDNKSRYHGSGGRASTYFRDRESSGHHNRSRHRDGGSFRWRDYEE
ncbi:uncharacterized protein LOC125668891 [Ostrea edulis]|uniref:uncharacterized protein LOC125668891 n=1 Tax=Ostrea edulis TaxID=37623 RepID=UPI0024AF6951|nr:uncharacterized protein LOC125668891 [Ostrea edulis]